jgi:hypothetical protein
METGYAIFIDTMVERCVPLVLNDSGKPFIYPTRIEAERDIVDTLMLRLEEFNEGLRDYEEAIHVEEYVLKVAVLPNGTVQPLDSDE